MKRWVEVDKEAMAQGYVEMGWLSLQISHENIATEEQDYKQSEARL